MKIKNNIYFGNQKLKWPDKSPVILNTIDDLIYFLGLINYKIEKGNCWTKDYARSSGILFPSVKISYNEAIKEGKIEILFTDYIFTGEQEKRLCHQEDQDYHMNQKFSKGH